MVAEEVFGHDFPEQQNRRFMPASIGRCFDFDMVKRILAEHRTLPQGPSQPPFSVMGRTLSAQEKYNLSRIPISHIDIFSVGARRILFSMHITNAAELADCPKKELSSRPRLPSLIKIQETLISLSSQFAGPSGPLINANFSRTFIPHMADSNRPLAGKPIGHTLRAHLEKLKVSDLNLSNRSRKALSRTSVTNVYQLATMTRAQFILIRGIGYKSLAEIESELRHLLSDESRIKGDSTSTHERMELAWKGAVSDWVQHTDRDFFTAYDIFSGALDTSPRAYDHAAGIAIGKIMRSLNWLPSIRRIGRKVTRGYCRVSDSKGISSDTLVFEGTIGGRKFLFNAATPELEHIAEISLGETAREAAARIPAAIVPRWKANPHAVKLLIRAWKSAQKSYTSPATNQEATVLPREFIGPSGPALFLETLIETLGHPRASTAANIYGLRGMAAKSHSEVAAELNVSRQRVYLMMESVERNIKKLGGQQAPALFRHIGDEVFLPFLRSHHGVARVSELFGDAILSWGTPATHSALNVLLKTFDTDRASLLENVIVDGDEHAFASEEDQVLYFKTISYFKTTLASTNAPMRPDSPDITRLVLPDRAIRYAQISSSVYLSPSGYIAIRNWPNWTPRTLNEMARMALSRHSGPMGIADLQQRLNLLFPERGPFSIDSLRSELDSDQGFIRTQDLFSLQS